MKKLFLDSLVFPFHINLYSEILSNNDGTIPTEFGQLTSLNSLSISAFSVLGDIPTELGRLSLLRSLGLSTGITGAIPTEIGQLSSLLNLYLPASSISGPLPTQLGLLTKLTRFLLHSSSSSLDGTIPTEVGNILSMQSFSLTSSYMTGSIPTQLGQWSGLTDLELKLASADGVIPTHLGQLTMLDQLSITSNTISGTIPTQLGIGTLAYLSLIMPEIEGTLPTQMGQMTSLTFLFLNLPSITGIIPTEVGQLTLLNQIHIKEPNQLTGECWPFPAGAGTVSVGVAFKCGCNSPTPLKSCIPPQDCETPNTAAADKCIACVDGADLTNEDECEDRNGCTANGGDVAACGNVANSVCTDVGLNLRTCECSLGSTGILPQNFTDDSNTFSGECYDADGCTLNGGQIAGCGNISNTLCANNGPNNRTCQCAPGYQGIPVTTLADDDNTISGVCEDVDGCTVNGGDVKACGNIANSVCSDSGANYRTCQCAPGYQGIPVTVLTDDENTISGVCEDVDGCAVNGGDVEACGNITNSVCSDNGLNNRTCQCATGSEGIPVTTLADDDNTISGVCEDIDGCSLNGGDVKACGNISNSECSDNGLNNRTCQCAPGYRGISVTTLADNDNTISGVCEDVDGCTVNGGDTKACGNIANSVCSDTGVNNRTCECATGYQGIPVTVLTDDNNTISGVCEDIDGCAWNGGGIEACGNVSNSVCSENGANSRTCQCAVGYYGVEAQNFTDDKNEFSGECVDIDGCKLNGGGIEACGNIKNSECQDNGLNSRICKCAPGYIGLEETSLEDAETELVGECLLEITSTCAIYGCETGICEDLPENQRMCTCSQGDWIIGGPFSSGILLDGSAAFTGCSSDLEVDDPVDIAQHVFENPVNLIAMLNRRFPQISNINVVLYAADTIKVKFTLPDTNRESLFVDIDAIAELWGAIAKLDSGENDQYSIEFQMEELEVIAASVFVVPSLLCALVCSVVAQFW
eukprot:TRINITY_DN609_c0_g1_i5.p1 TRINITY_DN609_c0_g1~~TRINITY_DN609_c0_g1_i5.p1  ORF type:complete len:981 (+),score=166.26 TRINITY_DN609_c0_g1_i5:777-3719(+)